MSKVVKLLSMSVETPLVIDSTEANVIEAALEHIPGRGIVNSINMENGRKRIDSVVPLVKKHGAAVIALTIDEIGMAKTRERKLEVAKKIYDIVVGEYGLAPEDLIYDALTFTLATGDAEWIDSGKETIEGIRLIKRELPGVSTILGVSNVSFGLTPEARGVLNSVFLHHCVQAGLDAAIVNPAHIRPYAEISAAEREMADDLVFNKRPDALQRFIEYFANVGGAAPRRRSEKEDPTAGMTPEQKIHWMILHRKKEGIEEQLDAAGVRENPVRVLNEVLLPAMKEVGDKFGAGELILPFVLQSAEVMKKAVKHLEQFLEKAEGYTKGKVVLATVYGDVHDIGKSLVNTILSNNGYTVFDLGKQVPVNTILDKAVEVGADAIGLSALLVSTSKQMPLCVQELDKRGMKIPVLIGGAAINRRFGRRALFVEGERAYDSGVFYCKDAFEGLETMDVLQDPNEREPFVVKNLDDARNDVFLRTTVGKDIAVGDAGGERSDVAANNPRSRAPVLGNARHARHPSRRSVRPARPRRALSSSVGRARIGRAVQVHRQERVRARTRASQEGREEKWLDQAGSRCTDISLRSRRGTTSSSTIRQRTPATADRCARSRASISRAWSDASGFASPTTSAASIPATSMSFRSRSSPSATKRRSTSRSSRRTTSTPKPSTRTDFRSNPPRRSPSGCTGASRKSSVLTSGKRYSWGYGACPDLDDHATVFKLLPAKEALGMDLTEAFQLLPEQSTAAVIIHHPEAKYYAVRGNGAGSPSRRPPLPENPLIARLLDPQQVIVFDGAMGTMLYNKGVFINQCYDELNLRAPDLVRDVHKAYKKGGRGSSRDEHFRRQPDQARAVRSRRRRSPTSIALPRRSRARSPTTTCSSPAPSVRSASASSHSAPRVSTRRERRSASSSRRSRTAAAISSFSRRSPIVHEIEQAILRRP